MDSATNALKFIVVAGVLDSVGNALFVAATRHGRLDVAAVLSSFYPATTVLLARFVLKERISTLQTTGMAAALIAVPLDRRREVRAEAFRVSRFAKWQVRG